MTPRRAERVRAGRRRNEDSFRKIFAGRRLAAPGRAAPRAGMEKIWEERKFVLRPNS
jgi:hypothetical protein